MRRLHPITRPGFTLVEILAVVVILAIASAVVLPQFGMRNDVIVASAGRLVMADLTYAQNRSIAQQAMTYVKFDTVNNRYSVYSSMSPATYVTHPIYQANYVTQFGSSNVNGFQNVLIKSASFGNSMPTIAFDELGTPYSYNSTTNTVTAFSGSGTVVLGCGSNTLTITVQQDTGDLTAQSARDFA